MGDIHLHFLFGEMRNDRLHQAGEPHSELELLFDIKPRTAIPKVRQ